MSPSSLTVQLLDGFKLVYNDQTVDTIGSGRQQALLAYLLLHRHAPQPRAYIAFQLWPDASEKQARRNLRKVLHRLRRAFPALDQYWQIDAQAMQWQPQSPCTLDVIEFERGIREAERRETGPLAQQKRLAEAIGHYQGDLLPSCYDDWIIPERERLRQLCQEALARLAQLSEEQGEYVTAIRHSQHLLRLDPLHEDTHGRLMRLHARTGDRATALRLYQNCVTLLDRELGVEPGAAVQRAYAQVLAQRSTTPLPSADPPHSEPELPLVGRNAEWQTLRTAWQQAQEQQIHFCLISGDAGIGKTRLAEELIHWAEQQGIATAVSHLYTAAGTLVYTPVIEWLQSPILQPALDLLDAVWLTELARLLPELRISHPDLPAPLPPPTYQAEQWQRQRLFEAMSRALLVDNRPKILLIDDVQWSDGETLVWLRYLFHFIQRELTAERTTQPILIMGTARSEELDADHPLLPLLLEWRSANRLTEIPLTALDPTETRNLATQVADAPLAVEQADTIYQQSEGNPLFVVEMVRSGWALKAHGQPQDAPSAANTPVLPPKVQAVIQQRLRQLSPTAQKTAALAAIIGRSFTFPLLQEASEQSEAQLAQDLDELWRRGIVRIQEIHTYDFSHDRIREAAYAEISPIQQPRLHQQVARALESVHSGSLDAVSAQIASHYQRAGNPEKAIDYYQRAASTALDRFAAQDALAFLKQGLALIDDLPESTSRKRKRLSLLLEFAAAAGLVEGLLSADMLSSAERARQLAIDLHDDKQLFRSLTHLHIAYQLRGHFENAQEVCEALVELAEELHVGSASADTYRMLVNSHYRLAMIFWLKGQLSPAHHHFEKAISTAEHSTGATVVSEYTFSALNTWLVGYPERARAQLFHALMLASEPLQPYSLSGVLGNLARLNYFMGGHRRILWWAQQTIAHCETYDIPFWLTIGKIFAGRGLAETGDVERGISQVLAALQQQQMVGHKAFRTHYICILAELYMQAGSLPEALATIDEGLALADETGEGFWLPEMVRVRGDILLKRDGITTDVEASYQRAIAIARRQQSKSLELRATMSLCTVWQQQDRSAEAHGMLEEIYNWFTEGFRTPDLRKARLLLNELS